MTVAVGADVHSQRDMEARTVLHDGLCVLGDLVVKHLGSSVIVSLDGVLVAGADAAAAT